MSAQNHRLSKIHTLTIYMTSSGDGEMQIYLHQRRRVRCAVRAEGNRPVWREYKTVFLSPNFIVASIHEYSPARHIGVRGRTYWSVDITGPEEFRQVRNKIVETLRKRGWALDTTLESIATLNSANTYLATYKHEMYRYIY